MADKKLDLAEIIELGLLQEINRTFLHPRGLVLALTPDSWTLYDYREDEAVGFEDLSTETVMRRANKSDALLDDQRQRRIQEFKVLGVKLGVDLVQPLGSVLDKHP